MNKNCVLNEKRVLLGVTGGVAVYKAVFLASRLTQAGARVDVVMTEAATRFVSPLSFEAVTRRRVFCDPEALYRPVPTPLAGEDDGVLGITHIELARQTDLMLIAPATANTLAKLAGGMADNLLTSIALACSSPFLIAPAMESHMWMHPATQANVSTLVTRGATLAGPASGHLASGASGPGRMSEPETILEMAKIVMARGGKWAGKRVVVSAGGTREAIDPVRFISNRSSGKMGYAQAIAARDLGAEVTLVTAPTELPDPPGITTIHVESAEDMKEAVLSVAQDVDLLVMAAAVADYRPQTPANQKIKKTKDKVVLELVRTPDILAEIATLRADGQGPKLVIGFAAETEKLLDHARAKLRNKNLDLIVANDVSSPDSGFEVNTNRVMLLWADGMVEPLPLMPKNEVAHAICDKISHLLENE